MRDTHCRFRQSGPIQGSFLQIKLKILCIEFLIKKTLGNSWLANSNHDQKVLGLNLIQKWFQRVSRNGFKSMPRSLLSHQVKTKKIQVSKIGTPKMILLKKTLFPKTQTKMWQITNSVVGHR